MAGKFQRRLPYRVTGLRPSGLPNLPFSLVLSFSSFVHSFSNFLSFHLFHTSLLFFRFFPQFSIIFPSLFHTFRFFQRFLAKATRLHVTPLSAMRSTKHRILRRTRYVVKENFCLFLGILWHIQKKGPNHVKSQKNGRFKSSRN